MYPGVGHLLKQNQRLAKTGSTKSKYLGPLKSGLSRRDFLKTTMAIGLLSGVLGCKPSIPNVSKSVVANSEIFEFTKPEAQILGKVLMHLFPDDGNGPSAEDFGALEYLEWALTDEDNKNDGDPEFIVKGIGWLDDLSQQTHSTTFLKLSAAQQHEMMQQTSQTSTGENWMALLIFYLTEALLLDPIYGGNINRVGWTWLEHQAGFPQPVIGKTYRDFD